MSLDFAIEELYATGWSTLDSRGCEHASDGRLYPSVDRARREFEQAGYELNIARVDLFDCYRAEWRDSASVSRGAVVGQSETEAAIYALAQLRRTVAQTNA